MLKHHIPVQTLIEQFIPTTIVNLQKEEPHYEPSPKVLHPAFYGCYDWHSAVHSHWQIVRALRLFPAAPFQTDAIALLEQHFTKENIAGELFFLKKQSFPYERPYGMAWFLQLMTELREWDSALAIKWREILTPLEAYARQDMQTYLSTLPLPNRSGLHQQTALALALALDWAHTAHDDELITLIKQRSHEFYLADRDAPLAKEPRYNDFLSPTLAEADLMRRILAPDDFSRWLKTFLPAEFNQLLAPVNVLDPSDGQLAHWAGLNMSRAWMLEGIASALPPQDKRRSVMINLAEKHFEHGWQLGLNQSYEISHWVPSFMIYLLTQRGLGK